MNLLLLDTSTKNFSVAVASQDRVLVRKNIILEKILSTSIIPSVVKILKKAKLKLREVDGFGVGIGPGSFTSLR
ncbi:MAG TPA: tRNA (adenosine(37)-N6)-threonylcarbamoyltransferase complex dimerization subunit type 1 TsaB, partial [Candidatus Omnitrophota bacterium]|nr:tRNA (adenosine(37)-N6)-threonylcarbamoyltransferase complex dimerization subunit type 1 TsaB [Candidatus Omnitrophota bacterium]